VPQTPPLELPDKKPQHLRQHEIWTTWLLATWQQAGRGSQAATKTKVKRSLAPVGQQLEQEEHDPGWSCLNQNQEIYLYIYKYICTNKTLQHSTLSQLWPPSSSAF